MQQILLYITDCCLSILASQLLSYLMWVFYGIQLLFWLNCSLHTPSLSSTLVSFTTAIIFSNSVVFKVGEMRKNSKL